MNIGENQFTLKRKKKPTKREEHKKDLISGEEWNIK